MDSNNIKITLTAARINAGYSQKEAAKILGLKPSTLADWEKDSTRLSYVEANRLAKLYGIKPDLLFFGDRNEFIRYLRRGAKAK